MAKCKAHKSFYEVGNVHIQLSSLHKLLVESNKKYISTIIDILLLLSN